MVGLDLCVVENGSVHPAALRTGLHADDCGRREPERHAKVKRGQGGDERHQNCDSVAAGDYLAAAGGGGVEQAGVGGVHVWLPSGSTPGRRRRGVCRANAAALRAGAVLACSFPRCTPWPLGQGEESKDQGGLLATVSSVQRRGFPSSETQLFGWELSSPRSISLYLSHRRTQPMRFCVVGPALSPRGLFSSLFFHGVVPVRALLFRTGTLLSSLVRQAQACRLALGPSEVLVV